MRFCLLLIFSKIKNLYSVLKCHLLTTSCLWTKTYFIHKVYSVLHWPSLDINWQYNKYYDMMSQLVEEVRKPTTQMSSVENMDQWQNLSLFLLRKRRFQSFRCWAVRIVVVKGAQAEARQVYTQSERLDSEMHLLLDEKRSGEWKVSGKLCDSVKWACPWWTAAEALLWRLNKIQTVTLEVNIKEMQVLNANTL